MVIFSHRQLISGPGQSVPTLILSKAGPSQRTSTSVLLIVAKRIIFYIRPAKKVVVSH
jgi:hypothetical protein